MNRESRLRPFWQARHTEGLQMASDTDLENAASEAVHRRLRYDVAGRIMCFRTLLDGKYHSSSDPGVEARRSVVTRLQPGSEEEGKHGAE